MILVDLAGRRVLKDVEIKTRLARRQPYRRWVEENKISIHGFFGAVTPPTTETGSLLRRQKYFGYTREDIKLILDPMAVTGNEPVGSMGADEPLAVLSEQPQLLYWYFKQLFAQVTNPAIDSIREELVMSLMTFLGTHADILAEGPHQARLIKLNHPILSNEDLARIRSLNIPDFACRTLPIGFPADGDGADSRRRARRRLQAGGGGRGPGRAHAHPERPRPARWHHGHPGPARRVGGQPPPAELLAAHLGQPHRRDGRSPRGHAHRPACSATAPRPSTRTWPSRASPTWLCGTA